jgi:hypothetical protein
MLNFMPSSWFIRNVNDQLTYKSWEYLFRNKFEFNSYARNYGLSLPDDYGIYNVKYGYEFGTHSNLSNADELEDFLKKNSFRKLVFKDLTGLQGNNIYFITDIVSEGNIIQLIIDNKKTSVKEFCRIMGDGEYLIEEYLKNNDFMNGIYPNSINTFRVFTFYNRDGMVNILGAYLRTGVGSSLVDNWHCGGMIIPVDAEKGCFVGIGYNQDYSMYKAHPDTHFLFSNEKIPLWEDLVKLVKDSASCFPMMRHIAWDIAFTSKGIVIVEANAGQIMFLGCQSGTRGFAHILRKDLKALGYDFPEGKMPPITARVFMERIIQIIGRAIGIGK